MKESVVIKDVLSLDLFTSLTDEMDHYKWELNNSYSSDEDSYRWWSIDTNAHNNPIFMAVSSVIKLKVLKHLRKKLGLVRIYFNGQTPGQRTRFHTDFDYGTFYTFILFSNHFWDTDWGGEFLCRNPNTNKYEYTPYIPNSGVLIPANWDHVGRSPNNNTQHLRTTVAFSFLDMEHTGDELDCLDDDCFKFLRY